MESGAATEKDLTVPSEVRLSRGIMSRRSFQRLWQPGMLHCLSIETELAERQTHRNNTAWHPEEEAAENSAVGSF